MNKKYDLKKKTTRTNERKEQGQMNKKYDLKKKKTRTNERKEQGQMKEKNKDK